AGPQLIEQFKVLGFDIFLDLKFHDIPNTVAKAVKAAAQLGVWMVNVHAFGGEKMMVAAREAIESAGSQKPLLIAVTVLTSLSQEELNQLGISAKLEDQVLHLAQLTKNAGLDGVVCSAREALSLKSGLGSRFILVTPGIRPQYSTSDDQHRTMTPAEAIIAGSNYLVIGRPITQADQPERVCEKILQSLGRSLEVGNPELNSRPL
ncbi:MAG: orotidine-5'-phosphate decarboxylase, partial [Cellvibrionaceae bacterium]